MLNERLREIRTARKISQVELARLLGVTKQCVSNWENDNVVPSIEMLEKLADYFRVSTDDILGRSCEETINVSGLTPEQTAHISMIVRDLILANRK